jgi:hypothetical protein
MITVVAAGSEIRIRNAGDSRGANSGVGSGCGIIGQPSEPVPGEDFSNLFDAVSVTEEDPSNFVGHVRFSILAHRSPLEGDDHSSRLWECALIVAGAIPRRGHD